MLLSSPPPSCVCDCASVFILQEEDCLVSVMLGRKPHASQARQMLCHRATPYPNLCPPILKSSVFLSAAFTAPGTVLCGRLERSSAETFRSKVSGRAAEAEFRHFSDEEMSPAIACRVRAHLPLCQLCTPQASSKKWHNLILTILPRTSIIFSFYKENKLYDCSFIDEKSISCFLCGIKHVRYPWLLQLLFMLISLIFSG